jgi:hypothetical protein
LYVASGTLVRIQDLPSQSSQTLDKVFTGNEHVHRNRLLGSHVKVYSKAPVTEIGNYSRRQRGEV